MEYEKLSKDELEQLLYERHTPQVYDKVKEGRVAVAGLGGLGSHVAIALARTGVGHLHLVDFDMVEPSNLNRQMYRICHLGKYKTEALQQEIFEINPYLDVQIDTVRVTKDNAVALFQKDEIICEAFDNPVAKAMLINTMLEASDDVKIVAASGMAGYESSNAIHTRRISKNFYVCGDEKNGLSAEMGLMAPRVSICAGHEANMILRILLKIKEA